MSFLEKELSELPEGARKVVLKQLEDVVREVHRTMSPHNTIPYTDLHYIAICAKIYSSLDFALKMRVHLRDAQDAATQE